MESSAHEILEKLEPVRAAAKYEAENIGHAVSQPSHLYGIYVQLTPYKTLSLVVVLYSGDTELNLEELSLLGCYAMWLLQEPTFRRNLAPPSSG
jgi:hypothetical protein